MHPPVPITPARLLAALLLLAISLLPFPPCAAAEEGTTGEKAVGGPAEAPTAPAPPIHRRSGLQPPDRAGMAAWHRRYSSAVEPVKEALSSVLRARREERPPHRLRAPCRRLREALADFDRRARRERVFPVADAAVDVHLKRLYLRLAETAEACTTGRWAETDEGLRRAGLAYSQARLALGRWELKP